MMPKVKLFQAYRINELEDMVEQFVAQNKAAVISTSIAGPSDGYPSYTLAITYVVDSK